MKKKTFAVIVVTIVLLLLVTVISFAFLVSRHQDDTEQKSDISEEIEKDEEQSKEEKATVVVESEDNEMNRILEEALLYALGKGRAQDAAQALALLEDIADDNMDAQFMAGEMYLQGIGTEQNLEKAAEYIQKAFLNGNSRAYEIYAKMCFLGEGAILQDYEKAAAVFSAIETENGQAAGTLGMMYALGMGVPMDFDVANQYLQRAAELGYAKAGEFQNLIRERVTGENKEWPEISQAGLQKGEIVYKDSAELADMVKEYTNQLLKTESYERFDKEIDAILGMDINLTTFITIFGKENWLFLQNPNDGDSYHDYIGDNAYTEEEMASIASHLMEQKAEIEETGAEFVLLLIPNKEIIYAEKMPTYIHRVSEETKTDKLVTYLKQNTDISIIYMKDQYNAYKDAYQLYYKTDTHCNMQGSFLAIADLLNTRYGKQIMIENTLFEEHMHNYCGDLSVLIGRQDRYNIDTVYFLPQSSVSEEQKVEDSLMLIGDSFSEFLNKQALYYFKGGVNHVMIMNHNYDFYQATKDNLQEREVDLVVWECAERYIDRLK